MKGKEFLHTMRAIKNLLLNCSAAGLVPSLSNGAFHSFSSYKWALTFGAKKGDCSKNPHNFLALDYQEPFFGSIGRKKQNFCAVRYTMRGLFLSWSQLSSQASACKVKLSLWLEYELCIKIWTCY